MNGLGGLIKELGGVVNYSIGLLLGIALLVFFWGLVRFIFHLGGDEKEVQESRNKMLWGIIALFVMLTIWGIVAFIQGELGILDSKALFQR